MFVLAIVLTTATFISQGQIEINLPVAESAELSLQPQEKNLVISINAINQIYLDDSLINLDSLSSTLKTIDKQTPIVFRVDKQVVFEHFVQIIDLLKVNKLEKFSIITVEK